MSVTGLGLRAFRVRGDTQLHDGRRRLNPGETFAATPHAVREHVNAWLDAGLVTETKLPTPASPRRRT